MNYVYCSIERRTNDDGSHYHYDSDSESNNYTTAIEQSVALESREAFFLDDDLDRTTETGVDFTARARLRD